MGSKALDTCWTRVDRKMPQSPTEAEFKIPRTDVTEFKHAGRQKTEPIVLSAKGNVGDHRLQAYSIPRGTNVVIWFCSQKLTCFSESCFSCLPLFSEFIIYKTILTSEIITTQNFATAKLLHTLYVFFSAIATL